MSRQIQPRRTTAAAHQSPCNCVVRSNILLRLALLFNTVQAYAHLILEGEIERRASQTLGRFNCLLPWDAQSSFRVKPACAAIASRSELFSPRTAM